MASKRVKGFLPRGGFSFKQSNSAYKKQGISNKRLINKTKDDKETQVVIAATGSSFNVVFTRGSIEDFLLELGDSAYIREEKEKLEIELKEKYSKSTMIKNAIISPPSIGFSPLPDLLNSTLGGVIKPNEDYVKDWTEGVNYILSRIYISFELKDLSGNLFGLSSKRPRFIYEGHTNDVASAQMDDSLILGKDGFYTNDEVYLTFIESTPISDRTHKCTYNSALFQATTESIFTITTIKYAGNSAYS